MSKNSIPPAHRALHKFKYELAAELGGTNYEYKTGYWGVTLPRANIFRKEDHSCAGCWPQRS